MKLDDIRKQINEYVVSNFIFDARAPLHGDQSLLESGVVDSTGILELITFVERRFGIHFEDTELVAENFDSVNKVAASIARKLVSQGALEHADRHLSPSVRLAVSG